ncbi:hypothetical protein GTW25_16805 [Aliihoeflea aestuarii]|jgi:ElaB/YqjD/DUF883 family membrane-anchored ribosome-binding protein|uniref:DUF883 family protein n=1 Tax=Aliihoeflea aestuarii TaxID=453840 RepID=UPI0020955FD2|nr:hypothetical protein [Aliihoeflea aestuarii]MCO6392687.1 hypothetical protein [Aliihoeflea aestuarii]
MSYSIFGGRRSWDDELERRISHLSKELSALTREAQKRGSHLYGDTRDTASDAYGELSDRIHDWMPVVRKQARQAEQTARDHPALVLAGVAVVGLAAALLLRR